MPRLNQILGALMADIASARHLADQHTILLAKKYHEDPLLRNLSVPRIRLPEVVVDLPLLVERCGETRDAAEGAEQTASPETKDRAHDFLAAAEQTLQDLGPAGASAGEDAAAPVLHVLVGADELKEHGGPGGASVMRLKLVLREEAMEWMEPEAGQRGESMGRLIPE